MSKSIFHGLGYNLNDNRASGGKKVEADLMGCFHCQALIDKTKWKAEGAFCHCCDGPVCSHCDRRMTQFGCENFIRKLDQAANNLHRQQQNSKVLGL